LLTSDQSLIKFPPDQGILTRRNYQPSSLHS